MEEIQQSKEALKEIHEFFKANIENGTFKNEGFNDGLSEQYNFKNFSVVISIEDLTGKHESYTYYHGDEELATVYSNNSTSLDEEFIDEVENVIDSHQYFRQNLKEYNQENKKTKPKTRKI